jgi:hypothetical protein
MFRLVYIDAFFALAKLTARVFVLEAGRTVLAGILSMTAAGYSLLLLFYLSFRLS